MSIYIKPFSFKASVTLPITNKTSGENFGAGFGFGIANLNKYNFNNLNQK